MEELAHSSETPAERLATERLTAAALDPDLYPNGTAFIASDVADFPAIMAQNVAEGRPLAILYPNGHELLVTPAQGMFAVLLATLLGGLLSGWRAKAKLIVESADGAEVITLPQKYRVQLRQPPTAVA
ncbi:MAG: hypothetical protein H0U00_12735 [Actinobacteria bacterium]|nr:hypothetical protein [Actinomycetota bacterium]